MQIFRSGQCLVATFMGKVAFLMNFILLIAVFSFGQKVKGERRVYDSLIFVYEINGVTLTPGKPNTVMLFRRKDLTSGKKYYRPGICHFISVRFGFGNGAIIAENLAERHQGRNGSHDTLIFRGICLRYPMEIVGRKDVLKDSLYLCYDFYSKADSNAKPKFLFFIK